MITVDLILVIHQKLLVEFGGKSGIRDLNLVESALGRCYQTFEGKDLYITPIEKAVALFESLISNHPFVDGNKRVAYTVLRLMLLESSFDLEASEDEKYAFVISCAKGELEFDQKLQWVRNHLLNAI